VEVFKIFLKNICFGNGPQNLTKTGEAKNILLLFSEPLGPEALRDGGEHLEL
jgi:hypothetical protein